MTDSNAGAIWCIAIDPTSTTLALGCEDGTIRLLSLSDDSIVHLKCLQRVNAKILTLAWGPMVHKKRKGSNRDNGGDDEGDSNAWENSFLVAGCSDSSIRKWSMGTGQVGETMRIKAPGEVLLVWAVGVTP